MAQVRSVAVTRQSARRPSRLLIALAALWMILSLALGGALNAERASGDSSQASITRTAER